ncbi:MAG TPA: MATE family efflux transporter [Elusimicrobia bacterium]|nr:MATE family efflux transporter [Elusimicrobiota bacterium]
MTRQDLHGVFVLALPIAALQLGMALFATVATVFAGRLGPDAIATVGLSGSTYFLLFILAMGVLLGIDPLSSRAYGAGRSADCAEILVHAAVLALSIALVIFVLLSNIDVLFGFMRIQPGLAKSAAAYMQVLRWALFPGLLFVACRLYLQTLNVTQPQLAAVVAGNIVNALLGYALIFGRLGFAKLGVNGAAWAAIAANGTMLLMTGTAAALEARRSGYRFAGFQRSLFALLLKIGAPAGLQMLAEVGAFSLVTMLSGRIGETAAAAHQIALNLASGSFMVPLGVSFAAAVRVGQGLGRGRPEDSARAGWAALLIGVGFMACTSLGYFLFPKAIVALYTSHPGTAALGVSLLFVTAFFQVFDGVQVVMTGALRGLGETRIPMLANAVGYWLIGLPVGAWLAFRRGWGVLGLWIGLCLGLCLVAVSLLWVWARRARTLRLPA